MFENFQVPKDLIPSDPRFASGPSLVPEEHLQALAKTGKHLMGTSHRKTAVKQVVKEIQEGLTQYFNLPNDYLVTLGNGGATLLFDMIGLGMVEKESAHFVSGEFSSKWYQSHKNIPWIKAQEKAVEFGQGIIPQDVAGVDMLCMTLNETSTGVIIPEIPTPADPNCLVAVDATSGGGQTPCDVSKTDIFFFSPQKVFASDGGLWVAILSPKAQERAKKIAADKSRYIPIVMGWNQVFENAPKNQTYNTPAIATLFLLNEQIKRMNKLGYKEVQNQANKKAELLYKWAEEKEYLKPFVEEATFRSNAVATIDVDEKVPVDDLINKLRKEKIVYGIDAYRKLGRNQFRIALFHNISYEDLEKLTKILSLGIESEWK